MQFRSDNAAPCPPAIMAALNAANQGHQGGYHGDDITTRARQMMRDRLDAPEAEVFFVPAGGAANSLALATMVSPYAGIYAHETAHINTEEGGAPEFFTGGAKIHGIAGDAGKITPETLRHRIHMTGNNFPHEMPRGAVSITNLTELGSRYSAAETTALAAVAREFDLPVHLDGARFANAIAHGNESPADHSWRAGVDVLVFGGTKLGALGVEAVVFFDPRHAREFLIRMKRGGHLLSKSRYLAAQFVALLDNDLWRDLATHANAMATTLATALAIKSDVTIDRAPEGNILFAKWPRGLHRQLFAQGAEYYLEPFWQSLDGSDDEMLRGRLVTSWATTESEIESFLSHF